MLALRGSDGHQDWKYTAGTRVKQHLGTGTVDANYLYVGASSASNYVLVFDRKTGTLVKTIPLVSGSHTTQGYTSVYSVTVPQ